MIDTNLEIRDVKKRANWQAIIDDFNQSGQNQTQYCKQRSINKDQFCYYLSRWRKANIRLNSVKPDKISFIPIETTVFNGKWVLKIDNGISLELPDTLSMEQLSLFILKLKSNLC